MRRALLTLVALVWLSLIGESAQAQVTYPPASSVIGTYTLATLPIPTTALQGKYAFVSDLGGGADTVLCDGTWWKHIRLGFPQTITSTTGTVVVTPLSTAPVLLVSGNVTTTMALSISTAGLYPGYILYVRVPGLVTGSLGVSVAGSAAAALPIAGNSTSMFIWDGSTLQRIQ